MRCQLYKNMEKKKYLPLSCGRMLNSAFSYEKTFFYRIIFSEKITIFYMFFTGKGS